MLIRRGLFSDCKYDGKSLNKKYISILLLLFISLFVVISLVLPRIMLLYSSWKEEVTNFMNERQ